MITVSRASELVKEYSPKSNPKSIFDFSNNEYLVFAPEDEHAIETPFFTVNKNSEKVSYFNPGMDIDSFNDAIEKGPIKEF